MSLQAAAENGQRGSSYYGDGEVLWGWGRRSTTGERGSSSYRDGGRRFHHWGAREQFFMGMGTSFHLWGAREQFLWG